MNIEEKTISVNDQAAKRLRSGNPLLYKEYFSPVAYGLREGMLLRIEDERGQFLARGYVGKQNVGYGWVLTRREDEEVDLTFFEKKIVDALNLRKSLFENGETTAFRVFNGEGDGIGGVTVDHYAGFYMVTWYSEGIYAYRKTMIEALERAVDCKGVYEKKRFATEGKYVDDDDDFVCGQRGEFPLLVKENGMHFAVDLNDGPMTGIFLDQRDVRKRIRDGYAMDQEVLNLFSYTGAFSVAAAIGGAKRTTSVDLANRSQAKTEEQFLVNGFPIEDQRIVVMDVFRYFSYARKKELSYDLIVLDPPSFARSKKKTFTVAKDYTKLLSEAITITKQGGVIVASTNASNVTMKKFKRFVDEAFKAEGYSYRIKEEYGVPEDFKTTNTYPAGRYLKVLFIEKLYR